MSALDTSNLSVDLGARRVVHGASFSVTAGEVVGLVGRNGSGKTTLLRAALGLVRLTGGQARIGGDNVTALTPAQRASRVGYLPQERTVGWNLPAWRVAALGAPLRPPSSSQALAFEALRRAGAEHLADRGVLDLSGGERATVLLARLLATGAPLMVADEPIAGLDPAAQIHTLEVLRGQARAGGAVLITLHDLRAAARYCDRVVVMAAGRVIAEDAGEQVFTSDVLQEGFGLSAMPG